LGLLVLVILSGCEWRDDGPVSSAEFIGHWSGSFRFLTDSVHVVLELSDEGSDSLSARVSLPAQGVFQVRASPGWEGRVLSVELPGLGSRYEGRLTGDGGRIRGDWYQAGGKFRLTLTPAPGPPELSRPQEPEPPFPYLVEDVRIPHSQGRVTLAGTLTLPEGAGPYPGVVLVSGSGPQDRDETLFGHKPFLVLADHLTRSGIAVLRYDDRGVAGSTGDFSGATSEDFATDALAAVDFLGAHGEVNPNMVGIIGHSEGGIVAPMAAVRSDRVAFIVSLAGTGISGMELLELQTRLIMEASGVPEPLIGLNSRIQQRLLGTLMESGTAEGALEAIREEMESTWGGLPNAAISALGLAAEVDRGLKEQLENVVSPWLLFFLSFDPTTAFERVSVPVLALNGTLDLQVPPDPNLARIREAVERGGNPDVTTVRLEGLNHLFQKASTGLPSEYGRIEETMDPEVLRLVADWILGLGRQQPREGGGR
jgi:fermentation-respiration switch protein FrsA (DUF1100 family)